MTDPHPLPDPLTMPAATIAERLARNARDGGAREFGGRLYALAMRYGDLRAQAAAGAAQAKAEDPRGRRDSHDAPYAIAWRRSVDIAERLAAELNPDAPRGPGIDPGRLDYLDRELGHFARRMTGDPYTDPISHAMLTTLRQLTRRYEEAMAAEGVPPEARHRVMNDVLYGNPAGYVEHVDLAQQLAAADPPRKP